jgi:hypothetical protein
MFRMRTQPLRLSKQQSPEAATNRHGLSWNSRPQEAVFGESNIEGPSGRKRAGIGSVVADTNDSAGCGETGSLAKGAS